MPSSTSITKRPIEGKKKKSPPIKRAKPNTGMTREHCEGMTEDKISTEMLIGDPFQEPISKALVERMIKAGVLRKTKVGGMMETYWRCPEQTFLAKLAKRIRNDFLPVKYGKPKCGFGRIYAADSFSLGMLRTPVRHTLCGEDWIDIDVANCHPTMIVQLCGALGLNCPALTRYVKTRQKCLESIYAMVPKDTSPKDAREAAKVLFIRIMYGGTEDAWRKGCLERDPPIKVIGEFPPIVKALRGEVQSISRTFQSLNPALTAAVKKIKKDDTRNFDGSFLSYYAQEWERRVLAAAFAALKANECIAGSNHAALCFDGLMILKAAAKGKDVITICQNGVRDKVGFDLTFTLKEMDESLMPQIVASELKEQQFVFDPSKMDYIDTDYLNSLESYALKKRYFEHFVLTIVSTGSYVLNTTKRTSVNGHETVEFISQSFERERLHKMFEHCGSGNLNKFGNEKRFAEEWVKDPAKRKVHKESFEPYNGVFDPLQDTHFAFNTFKGYNPHIHHPLKEDTPELRKQWLTIFNDIGLHVFEGNERMWNLFKMCVARQIQFPNHKQGWIWVIKGCEGAGKNYLLTALANIMGLHHYICTDKATDLFGEHATGFDQKLMVCLNEAESRDTTLLQNRFKAAATEELVRLNEKHKTPRDVKNLAMMVVLSNKPNPIVIDTKAGKERRYIVATTLSKYANAKKYTEFFWGKAHKQIKEPTFVRILYDELNGMDLSQVQWKAERKACLTKSYYDLTKLYAPIEAQYFLEYAMCVKRQEDLRGAEADDDTFLKSYMPNPFPSIQEAPKWGSETRYKKCEIRKQMTSWANEMGYSKFAPTAQKFYNTIATGEYPVRNCTGGNGYELWEFDPAKMVTHITETKNWCALPASELPKMTEEEAQRAEDDRKEASAKASEATRLINEEHASAFSMMTD